MGRPKKPVTLTREEINRAVDVYRLGPLLSLPIDQNLVKHGLVKLTPRKSDEKWVQDPTVPVVRRMLSETGFRSRCSSWPCGGFYNTFFNRSGGVRKKWWSEAESFTEHMKEPEDEGLAH